MRAVSKLAVAGLVLSLAAPALAGESGDALRNALYDGKLKEGLETLSVQAVGGDAEARFGVGALRLAMGFERFGQALYRHGIALPGQDFTLLMPLGVPVNPDAEPLDYDKVRAELQGLVSDMDAARADLELAAAAGDYVVMIDPTRIRLDVNGDGIAEESESIAGSLGDVFGEVAGALDVPDRDGKLDEPQERGAIAFGFDRADAYWLAGYSQIIAAQADFLLAHDFSMLVNVAFHRLFPAAKLPMQAHSGHGTLFSGPESDAAIADAIAAIHTLNWPVVDAARLKGVLERLSTITSLSRKNWEAIEAETDDRAELLPSPRQTSPVPGARITEEIVAAWRETLDSADKVLAGELLVPHWRFSQGFDVKAYFETARQTDLVMIFTGYGALPYLREGPVASGETFASANRVFGDNFLGYALWFN